MKGAKNMSEIQNAIEVKNLKKGFGGRVLFENFSLNVKANTIHAIIGPNGSGKTTLLRLITGVYQPNAGTINIAGKYAMELENDYLYEEQTGLENLRIFGKYFGFEINDRSDSYYKTVFDTDFPIFWYYPVLCFYELLLLYRLDNELWADRMRLS